MRKIRLGLRSCKRLTALLSYRIVSDEILVKVENLIFAYESGLIGLNKMTIDVKQGEVIAVLIAHRPQKTTF